jgi:hypothetical protein
MENKINDLKFFNPNPQDENNSYHTHPVNQKSSCKTFSKFNQENLFLSSCHSSNETVFTQRKSAFKSNFSSQILKTSSKNKSKNCFEIIKELKTIPHYDDKKNYYFEYWNIFQENEVILEKIKESSAEIYHMKNKIDTFKIEE